MAIFNRKDAKVKEDALRLSEHDFLVQYQGATTETVLRSVWAGFSKDRKVTKTADDATELTPISEFKAEDGDKVEVLKTDAGRTVVEVTSEKDEADKEEKVSDKATKEKVVAEGEAKPGRTPRMRELIKELGADKAKVKAQLEAEGFTTTGAGFHSEWNRVSKSIAK